MIKPLRTIVVILLLGIPATRCFAQTVPVAQKGILDLRNTNLAEKPVPLNGEWLFYWKQLLQPGETSSTAAQVSQYPSLWTKDKQQGALTATGYATYTLTILSPKQKPVLAMEVPDAFSSYKLFVNGRVIAQNGVPGKTEATSTPFWATKVVVLPAAGDTLQLVLQVANYWHSKGGVYKQILLGDKDQLLLKYHRETAFDLVLCGCLFMGGLFFFGLFLFARKDKTILYFSLFCMVYSYRMVGTKLYVLHAIFPNLSWFITVRLEYLALVLGVGLFSEYTRCLYPKETTHLFRKFASWCCWIYMLIILCTPPSLFSMLIKPFLLVMFLYIVYAFYVYIQAVRHKRSGSIYALLSSGVMLLVF